MSNLVIVTVIVVLGGGGFTFLFLGFHKKLKPYKRHLGLGFIMLFFAVLAALIGIIESVDENCCWDSAPYDSWQIGN